MTSSTRDKLLAQAEILFAEKGFYGTSINDVAAELSLTKQGLLHHFPTKEKLYAAVLENAAEYILSEIKHADIGTAEPDKQLMAMLSVLVEPTDKTNRVVRLLMRELLDNRQRAESAQQWFLKPVLDQLEQLIINAQKQGSFARVHPLAFIYQLLGAIQYYAISIPTLKRLYSTAKFKAHQKNHMIEIERLITVVK